MSDFVNTRTSKGDQATLDALIANTLTELKEDGVRKIGAKALYSNQGLTSVEFPNVTDVGASGISVCPKLQSVKLAACISIGANAFESDVLLEEFEAPEATSVGNNAFKNTPIPKLTLPKVTTIGTNINTENGSSEVDLSAKPSSIPANAFATAYNMTALILRNSEMVSLAATNAFANTPIAKGYGWIYVPTALVDTYKAATNWSTYASQIVSIESYPRELQSTITDTWAQIFAAEDNGTYSTKYSVGDTKFVKVNGIPVLMQIAAMDADELADGSGNAKITWLCKGYQGKHVMNPTNDTTGGWESCTMRRYLREDVLPGIESTVYARIKLVHKTYKDYNASATKTSADSIWIPSFHEMGFGTNIENSGVVYSGLFTDNDSRIKYAASTANSAAGWWLRSANNGYTFYFVSSDGASYTGGASYSYGVVFGFCT